MPSGGYVGKLLHFDLTQGRVTQLGLPDEKVLRKYIGGFGLGLHLLFEKVAPGMSARDPENPMIFLNGPLTGTTVPAPTNATLTTINAATGFTAARSHSHGYWGPYLKRAGYDGIIIEGASRTPVYLWITEKGGEIRDASAFWGKELDTHDTEDAIRAAVGNTEASVAAIGPAGENLCEGALIENDKHHTFAHSGVGMIAGTKKLKAIAVWGDKEVPVHDKKAFKAAAKEWHEKLFQSGLAAYLKDAGIPRKDYGGPRDYFGILAARNFLWTHEDMPNYGKGMSRQEIQSRPCFRCPIGCPYEIKIVEGPFKGYVATPCGGGENTEGAASIMGVDEVGAIYYLLDLVDRLGINSTSSGLSIAVAMEAWDKGLLTKEDTGGLELKWGDVKAIETLLRQIAHRQGFGALLADGPKAAGERVGLPDAGIHVKGSPINLHDWRNAWSVLLGQVVGGGVSWPVYGSDVWTNEPDLGYTEMTDPTSPHGKAAEAASTAKMKVGYFDSMGCCSFGCWGVPGITELGARAIAAATGWTGFTKEEQLLAGERIFTLERIFNMRMGLTAADDFTNFSPRLLEAPRSGKAKGKTIAPYLRGMIQDYYECLGWDRHSGKPLKSTIRRLGLEEYEEYIWP